MLNINFIKVYIMTTTESITTTEESKIAEQENASMKLGASLTEAKKEIQKKAEVAAEKALHKIIVEAGDETKKEGVYLLEQLSKIMEKEVKDLTKEAGFPELGEMGVNFLEIAKNTLEKKFEHTIDNGETLADFTLIKWLKAGIKAAEHETEVLIEKAKEAGIEFIEKAQEEIVSVEHKVEDFFASATGEVEPVKVAGDSGVSGDLHEEL
jgi:hypothetical protein